MLSLGKDLQWADGVHGVHVVVEGNEDLERLDVALRFLDDCTHLAGVVEWWKRGVVGVLYRSTVV